MERTKKIFEGYAYIVISLIFGVMYMKKVMPFDVYTQNSFQIAVNTVWVYLGWGLCPLFGLCGMAELIEADII